MKTGNGKNMSDTGNTESIFGLYVQLTFIADNHSVGKPSVILTEICGKNIFNSLPNVIGKFKLLSRHDNKVAGSDICRIANV